MRPCALGGASALTGPDGVATLAVPAAGRLELIATRRGHGPLLPEGGHRGMRARLALLLAVIASAAVAGCGFGSGDDAAEQGPGDGDARLRRRVAGREEDERRERLRHGDAAAAERLRGRDPLRRQLRAGDRGRRGRAGGWPPRRLVLLRQRHRVLGRRRRASRSSPGTASGGTITTGRARSASPPWSARSPSRSSPAARAAGCRCGLCAWPARATRATRWRRGSPTSV